VESLGQFKKTVQKVSRRSGKFPDSLESVQAVWKVSIYYGNFLDSVDLRTFGAYMSQKEIYALLVHICRENDLRTPSGKFLGMKFCQPESFDFLCLCRGAISGWIGLDGLDISGWGYV